jgi:hypothetical protein
MTWLEIAVAALATWQAVEVWHHGSIFAGARAWMELKTGFWMRLLLCPFCLTVWVSTAFVLVLMTERQGTPEGWFTFIIWAPFYLLRMFVYGLAVARLANLGNDLTHRWCRTPGGSRWNRLNEHVADRQAPSV